MAKINFSEITSTSFTAILVDDNDKQITTGEFIWSCSGVGTGYTHTFTSGSNLTADTLYTVSCGYKGNSDNDYVKYESSVRTLSDSSGGGGTTPPPSGGEDDFEVELTQGTTTSTSLVAKVSANLPIQSVQWYLDDDPKGNITYNGALDAAFNFSNLQPKTGYLIMAKVTSITGKTADPWGFFTTNSESTNTPIYFYFYPNPKDGSYGSVTVKNVLGQELQSGAVFYSNDDAYARTVTSYHI